MRPMTVVEQRAHAIWTLRAALNVAALQCQYSPSLATVRNYNDFLRQHGGELAAALTTMTGHFRRLDGPRAAQNSFDQYTTRSYNAFSTLDTQLTFCEAASGAGRDALLVPKGRLGASADALNAALHSGLVQVAHADPLRVITPEWAIVEPIPAPKR